MVISKTVTINGKEFTKTYSNSGFYIQRDGILYEDAVDPVGSGREYTESDEKIPVDEDTSTVESRLDAVEAATLTNAANIDYLAMMTGNDLDGGDAS